METLSLIISIAVIIGMTASFSILFISYVRYKVKHILFGHEDNTLKEEICKDFHKHNKRKTSISEFIQNRFKKEKKVQFVINSVFGAIVLCVLFIGTVATIYRINGNQFYLNNTTYLTIRTGSMETKNPNNSHYSELPNNQIETYSLVGIDRVEEDDLNLYDIIAFKYEDRIYVHRIVDINISNGTTYYTTQGDANDGSFAFETNLVFNQIIGKYNGFKNIGLGFMSVYFSANIGIIAWSFSLIFIFLVEISESYIDKIYKKRILEISINCDKEENDQLEHVLRYNRSFISKLIQANDVTKEWYSDLKNVFLSYKKIHLKVSWKKETIRYKRQLIGQFVIRGKTLCLILINDTSEIDNKENYEIYRIRSNRRVKFLISIIENKMSQLQIDKADFEPKDWYLPYENDVVLLKHNLIKRKILTVKEASFYTQFNNENEVIDK